MGRTKIRFRSHWLTVSRRKRGNQNSQVAVAKEYWNMAAKGFVPVVW